jgi:hypothetical protein
LYLSLRKVVARGRTRLTAKKRLILSTQIEQPFQQLDQFLLAFSLQRTFYLALPFKGDGH